MPIDLSKLAPAPWTSGVGGADDGSRYLHPPRPMSVFTAGMNHPNGIWEAAWFITQTDRDFAVLARNAFDVMMRRGWHPVEMPSSSNWGVMTGIVDGGFVEGDRGLCIVADDPFTALVAADEWWKQHAAPERP